MEEQIRDCKHESGSGWNLYRIGKWGAIAIILYFLLTEHRAHVIQFLPFLLLLSCPLMHFFMHGKHRHSDHQRHPSDSSKKENA